MDAWNDSLSALNLAAPNVSEEAALDTLFGPEEAPFEDAAHFRTEEIALALLAQPPEKQALLGQLFEAVFERGPLTVLPPGVL